MTPQAPSIVPARACTSDRVAVAGAGRMAAVLAAALAGGGIAVERPLRGGEFPSPAASAVLLCVPDGLIEAAAAALAPRPGLLVGHTSAATTLPELVRAPVDNCARLGAAAGPTALRVPA